jgi:hypothetical protein
MVWTGNVEFRGGLVTGKMTKEGFRMAIGGGEKGGGDGGEGVEGAVEGGKCFDLQPVVGHRRENNRWLLTIDDEVNDMAIVTPDSGGVCPYYHILFPYYRLCSTTTKKR